MARCCFGHIHCENVCLCTPLAAPSGPLNEKLLLCLNCVADPAPTKYPMCNCVAVQINKGATANSARTLLASPDYHMVHTIRTRDFDPLQDPHTVPGHIPIESSMGVTTGQLVCACTTQWTL